MRLALAAALLAGAGATLPPSTAPIFRRGGGGRIVFSAAVRIWCSRWEPDVAVQSLHAAALPSGRGPSYWMLSAVLRDVRKRPRVRVPVGFVWNRPKGAEIFVYDASTKNEASTETEKAHGTVEFSRVSCRKGRRVTVTIHAVLGSEFSDGGNVRVDGSVRGVVGTPPAAIRNAKP